MIYLDYSANTPADEAVLQCFVETERTFFGNPNSTHPAGIAAGEEMARVIDSMATLLNVSPAEILLTSGASESNNTAVKGIARSARHKGKHILSTPLEHPSVSGCLTALQEQGWEIELLPIGRNGKIDCSELRELLRKDTVLLSITLVDSELGTIQPLSEIREILKDFPDCRLHVDATQAVGKIPVSFDGIDTMSFAPHKFYGLNGSGVLLKRRDLVIEPLIHGGSSTTLYRSGTPALGLASAMETALRLALTHLEERYAAVSEKNARLRQFFASYPKVQINSPADAVPHILNLSVPGVKGTTFQRALSEKGVCVSVKSACSTEGTPSRAVFAVSRDRKTALSSFRISLSHQTTDEELSEFETIFDQCYRELTK